MSEKKKKYCVTIVETLEVAVSVFAESEEQAHELVSNMYYDQEIILTEEITKQQSLSFKTTKEESFYGNTNSNF